MAIKKLSEIWIQADAELRQTTGTLYKSGDNSYCALGAVGKIALGNPNSPEVGNMTYDGLEAFDDALRAKYGCGIITLNDSRGWPFRRFAQEAERMGY